MAGTLTPTPHHLAAAAGCPASAAAIRYYRYMAARTMTAGEVARALGVQPVTVRAWAADGRIPFDRTVGGHRRFSLEEVVAAKRSTVGLLGTIAPFLAAEVARWALVPLNVTLFGSVARGDERSDSDVDLLVVAPPFPSAASRSRFGEQLVRLHFTVGEHFDRDLREVELDREQLERVARGSAGLLVDILAEGTLLAGVPLHDLLLPIVEDMEASTAA